MLTSVDCTNPKGESLQLSLRNPTSGFIITEIVGLDPVKASVSSTQFALMDGAQYQMSRRDIRNILMTLKYAPNYATDTVSSLRQRLYNFFMPKSSLDMTFHSSSFPIVMTNGRVESCEAPLFTKEPQAVVSLLCFNPDFYETGSTISNGTTSAALVSTDLTYTGTVATGVIFHFTVTHAIPGFSIAVNSPTGVLETFDFTTPLQPGDSITVNTNPGQKAVTLMRGSLESSAIYGVAPNSKWVKLTPGINQILVSAEGTAMPYTIEYTKKYGGL